jgi:hypothetical protein
MGSNIDDLVRMNDMETLYDLMEGSDEWMMQLDAAEGLAKLGERAGLDFLLSNLESDAREVREYARTILDDPAMKRKIEDIEAEEKRDLAEKVRGARERVQKGRKVFIYRSLSLPMSNIFTISPSGEAVDIPELDEAGLEGWEVVNFVPRRGGLPVGSADASSSDACFILRKEITPDDITELDSL